MNRATLATMADIMRAADDHATSGRRALEHADDEGGQAHALLAIDGRLKALVFAYMMDETERLDAREEEEAGRGNDD